MRLKLALNQNLKIIIGLVLGILVGYWDNNVFNQIASLISQIFMNLFKLISAPIIFLSIFSTTLGMNNIEEFKNIGKKLVKYTLITTYIASVIALILYLLFDPARAISTVKPLIMETPEKKEYLTYFMQTIPSNIISPFYENHVISVLFLAILFSFASLGLPSQQRLTLHSLFSSLHGLIIKIASWIIYLIPIAVWSFMVILIKDVQGNLNIKQITLYLLTIIAANLVQGMIVLPLFVKSKGISPIKLAHDMLPALLLAFFSKSSSVALPMTMRCAEEKAKMPKKLTNLAFPLCTAINMNGCAAFILTTVLFVSMNHGIHFSIFEMILWTFIATIAAVGNAGVPMGCYFLSSAFLVAMNIPLNVLAIILPFYSIIDMLETTVNVWSDSCVVAVVDCEAKKEFDSYKHTIQTSNAINPLIS